jgi:hypothetical protein
MPLYCYICDDCKNEWEDFKPVNSEPPDCIICKGSNTRRNYAAETKTFFQDIKPYFDFSIGQHIKGRRDKATKYRDSGHTMMYGGQGGDTVLPDKRFYGDEEYAVKSGRINKPEPDWKKKYNEAVQEGLESPGREDEKDGTLI